ncbi:MAG: sigma-54 dependent transcriptional regulator [Nitrospinota bacterium]
MLAKKSVVLIVDDDKYTRETLYLEMKRYYSVFQAHSAEDAFNFLSRHRVNVILLDIKLPGMDGITALAKIRKTYPEIEVIMISAIKEAETVVKAIKAGAYNYFTKDLDVSEIMLNIDNALEKQGVIKEKLFYKSEIEKYTDTGFVVGKSHKMMAAFEVIEKTANLDANIIITGKSGTGKELVARTIHNKSNRKDKPFVPINMASLPDGLVESILFGHEKGAFTGAIEQHIGKFEMADGGTLFLDEIGELKMDLQAKLLRVLQDGELEMVGSKRASKVNVRLLAATNADLQEKVAKGLFREDLFYRLNVIPIDLPTLQERIEDLPLLIECFINKYGKKFNKPTKDISKEAVTVLSNYHWPGNIRELENLIARIIAITDVKTINADDIPIDYHIESLLQQNPGDRECDILFSATEVFERNCIMLALKKNQMSRKKTAASLGVPLSTFKAKLKKHGITKILNNKKDKNT